MLYWFNYDNFILTHSYSLFYICEMCIMCYSNIACGVEI